MKASAAAAMVLSAALLMAQGSQQPIEWTHWGADLAQAPHGEPFDADFAQRLLARLTASAASPPAVL